MALKLMFAKIVDKYDLLNHVLTFGLDVLWRRMAAEKCECHGIILDLCCGTGELSLHLSKLVSLNTLLVGLDFTRAMLRRAMHRKTCSEKVNGNLIKRSWKRDNVQKIDFLLADAANLPFKNDCINCIGMSFSFRNLIFRNPLADTYLREILRVLRIGGRFVFVETSQPRVYPLRILLHFYLKKIVPLIGGLISGCKPAYRYLGISAVNFPSAEEVKEMLEKIGFQKVSFTHMTFGIVAIHLCRK